ncbi:hypothetical protein CMO90_02915 [Candidatus Woesearchaeota archaeon]|jgi:ubiquinone/menaquinone biosynthesis C-methylase UbiE|nr:hypothetical protein [Candidatus Woesearchaeota archaeon]|tara:strand:- start:893 stop:1369 length:477 start_codon:yes stop_codon:yes gene_type:complete
MKNYYDDFADGYLELHREEQLNKLRIIKNNLKVGKNDLILDVGCGPGFSAEFFDCKIIGLDPSFENLKKCSFETVKGFAEKIPFQDDYFDCIISVTAIHNFKNFRKGLLEMKRVGKKFAFSVLRKVNAFDDIELFIQKHFVVEKIVYEKHDCLFFCRK